RDKYLVGIHIHGSGIRSICEIISLQCRADKRHVECRWVSLEQLYVSIAEIQTIECDEMSTIEIYGIQIVASMSIKINSSTNGRHCERAGIHFKSLCGPLAAIPLKRIHEMLSIADRKSITMISDG